MIYPTIPNHLDTDLTTYNRTYPHLTAASCWAARDQQQGVDQTVSTSSSAHEPIGMPWARQSLGAMAGSGDLWGWSKPRENSLWKGKVDNG